MPTLGTNAMHHAHAPPPTRLLSLRSNSSLLTSSARLMSPRNAAFHDVDDDVGDGMASNGTTPASPMAAPSAASSRAAHAHSCDSCCELETEFAAAVLFVESYQGPHRILTQENSTPKKDFYAYFQQATVGTCPSATPPPGFSKLEIAKWEQWRNLGKMTRQEAMKRYTTTLDNLVDDWRRSASVKGTAMHLNHSHANTTNPSNALKKSTSMFERLPKIYDEFGELQDRLDEEIKKRDELEAHLLNFTRENRALFSREMRQVDQMRSNLTSLVKSLETDVARHYNELQQVQQRQQELMASLDSSLVLACELRGRQVVQIVYQWLQHPLFRRVLICLLLFRLWNFVRRRGLPQTLAQLLIKWITSVSAQ